MKTAKKIQAIWRRNAGIKTWTKYTGVLSEGYIYLFAKPKDPMPECYIWVRNSELLDQDIDIVGMGNAFLVRNKYSETIFATEKPETTR
jgi:vacuolar protein sorting-associated protein 13A/C